MKIPTSTYGKSQKSDFTSEWGMAQYQSEQLADLMKASHELGIVVGIKDINSMEYLTKFYSVLFELYKKIRPIMTDFETDECDVLFKLANTNINEQLERYRKVKKFNLTPHRALEIIHMTLIAIIQWRGLGWPISVKKTEGQKLESLMNDRGEKRGNTGTSDNNKETPKE